MFSSFANAENISSSIAEKNYTKINEPVFVVNGITNFSASNNRSNREFEANVLPDQVSKNYLHNSNSIGNDTQIFFKSGFKTESKKNFGEKKFGAIAKVEFNYNSNNRKESPNLDQELLFAETEFGKFEFGNYFAVNQKMKYGPARIARGAGGINGKYLEQVNLPMLGNGNSANSICNGNAADSACANVKLPRFIMLSQSPIGHGGYAKSFYRRGFNNNYQNAKNEYSAFNRSNFRALKDESYDGVEDATKLSYYSPRLKGLQIGGSFARSTKSQGFTKLTALDVDDININNIFSFGANYLHDFDNLGLAISITGETGKQNNSRNKASVSRNDLMSYDISSTLSYFGFTVSGSYGSWGKSLQPKSGVYSCNYDSSQNLDSQNCQINAKKFSKAYYYSLGVAYQIGPFGSSITSLNSDFQNNKYGAISFGVDYKIKKNLITYLELTRYSFRSNQPQTLDITNQNNISNSSRQLKNNQGQVLLTGIYYSF